MKKRVAFFVRVGTDAQTTETQQLDLEAVAKQDGWKVVDTYADPLRTHRGAQDDKGVSPRGRSPRSWHCEQSAR